MSDTPAVRLAVVPVSNGTPTSADPAEEVRDRPGADRPTSPAAVEPLLVPAPEAARLCGISEASWYRLKSASKLPAPVRLGGRVLWRVEELRLFVAWGCPDRKTFEARLSARSGNGRK